MEIVALGRFGDRRLEKGGSSCMSGCCAVRVMGCGCGVWGRTGPEKSG